MSELTFLTGNADKFAVASQTCKTYDIQLMQSSVHIDEVQSEDTEYIAVKKAEAAFNRLGTPVVISDDSWSIPELKGFPGPYMKSMNQWFEVDDFLRLTSICSERTIILSQFVVYQDESEQFVFRNDVSGKLLKEPRGDTSTPITALVVLDGDDGKTIAEPGQDTSPNAHKNRDTAHAWHEFAKWYQEHKL